jgi:hypothetical protein
MTILRNTAKAGCLMVPIIAVAVVLIVGIGFIAMGIRVGKGFGPSTFSPSTLSPFVEAITLPEQDIVSWYLSPSGDKLLYQPRVLPFDKATIRFLVTGQEMIIADCPRFNWLDNESIYCYDYDFQDDQHIPSAVINNVSENASDFERILIKAVIAEEIELDTLLSQAKTIYRLQHSYSVSDHWPDSLLILDTEPQENIKQYYHLTEIDNLDEVLKNYNHITVFLFDSFTDSYKKTYSPNKNYYYLLQNNLGIYDATNDQLLAEFKPPPPSDYKSHFELGGSLPNKTEGWASDSSGVYFHIHQSSGFDPSPSIWPIQKLCVLGTSSCSSKN